MDIFASLVTSQEASPIIPFLDECIRRFQSRICVCIKCTIHSCLNRTPVGDDIKPSVAAVNDIFERANVKRIIDLAHVFATALWSSDDDAFVIIGDTFIRDIQEIVVAVFEKKHQADVLSSFETFRIHIQRLVKAFMIESGLILSDLTANIPERDKMNYICHLVAFRKCFVFTSISESINDLGVIVGCPRETIKKIKKTLVVTMVQCLWKSRSDIIYAAFFSEYNENTARNKLLDEFIKSLDEIVNPIRTLAISAGGDVREAYNSFINLHYKEIRFCLESQFASTIPKDIASFNAPLPPAFSKFGVSVTKQSLTEAFNLPKTADTTRSGNAKDLGWNIPSDDAVAAVAVTVPKKIKAVVDTSKSVSWEAPPDVDLVPVPPAPKKTLRAVANDESSSTSPKNSYVEVPMEEDLDLGPGLHALINVDNVPDFRNSRVGTLRESESSKVYVDPADLGPRNPSGYSQLREQKKTQRAAIAASRQKSEGGCLTQ